MMIVESFNRRLPRCDIAEPQVHLGSSIEIDVARHEEAEGESIAMDEVQDGGGLATVAWARPRPTLVVASDLPNLDGYEVRAYDMRAGRRLVAAVELVSPANKNQDRPEYRRVFVSRCAALIQERICVVIVDVVTTRSSNLYFKLMAHLGQTDPSLTDGPPPLDAVTCRWVVRCRRCRSGSPRTWRFRSNWNRATKRRAGSCASRSRACGIEKRADRWGNTSTWPPSESRIVEGFRPHRSTVARDQPPPKTREVQGKLHAGRTSRCRRPFQG